MALHIDRCLALQNKPFWTARSAQKITEQLR